MTWTWADWLEAFILSEGGSVPEERVIAEFCAVLYPKRPTAPGARVAATQILQRHVDAGDLRRACFEGNERFIVLELPPC